MFNLFREGGIFMWPLLLLAITVLLLSIKKLVDLFLRTDLPDAELESGINAIIFWGGFSFLFGTCGHFTGIYYAMQALRMARDISPMIVAHGYAMSLITMLTGMVLFLISALVWFVCRWRYKSLIRNTQKS